MLASALRRAARLHGDAVAFLEADRSVTWADLLDRGARLAGGLRARGLGPGARIAVLLPNGLDMVEVFVACILSDLVFTPLNVRLTAEELSHALMDSTAAILVVNGVFGERGREAAALATTPVLDASAGDGEPDALSGVSRAARLPETTLASAADLLGIFYTGGTTGRPKGVMLSRGALGYGALATIAEGGFGPGETIFHASPAFHIAGAMAILASIVSGATGVLTPGFEAERLLRLIERHRITQGLLVPTMLRMMLDHPACADTDLSSLNILMYGASPMPAALLERAMRRLPDARFLQLYGMTETSGAVCFLSANACIGPEGATERLASVGRAMMGSQVCVMDDAGIPAAIGALGEICVKGPSVMSGYWNRPEATRSAIRDGWMRTGDGGHMDQNGYVFLADRLKDMIISGGENVFSVEVENVLARHPSVRECAVIGVPHEIWGEAVHAIVVPHDGAALKGDDVMAFCHGLLGGFKRPRSVTVRTDPLPVSAAGKILKAQLRAELQAG